MLRFLTRLANSLLRDENDRLIGEIADKNMEIREREEELEIERGKNRVLTEINAEMSNGIVYAQRRWAAATRDLGPIEGDKVQQ